MSAQKCYYQEPHNLNISELYKEDRRLTLIETSYIIGVKVLTRLPGNFLAGYFISKLGSEYIVMLGLMIYGASLIMYVYSNNCLNFLISTSIEGIAASFTINSAYSFLTSVFEKKNEKSIAMAFANFCYYTGICFGPFIGGYIYTFYGHDFTFLLMIPFHLFICVLSIISLINWKNHLENYIILNEIPFGSGYVLKENNFFEVFSIFVNPNITIVSIGIAICSGSIMALSTVLAQWMQIAFQTERQNQGIIWIFGGLIYGISGFFSYLIQNYLVKYSYCCPLIGICLISISIFTAPFYEEWKFLCLNIMMLFFGIGMVEYYLIPLMSIICHALVDRKSHSIAATMITTSYSLGNLVGALFAGFLSHLIGFQNTCMIFGCIIGIYAPLTVLLSNYFNKDYSWNFDKSIKKENILCNSITSKLLN